LEGGLADRAPADEDKSTGLLAPLVIFLLLFLPCIGSAVGGIIGFALGSRFGDRYRWEDFEWAREGGNLGLIAAGGTP
jgi:hypothetical protein